MTMLLSTDGRPSDANLSSWRTAPFNRWAFNNVRSIIPVAEIEHAPGGVLALHKAVPEITRCILANTFPRATAAE
jgi:hypothetical protein